MSLFSLFLPRLYGVRWSRVIMIISIFLCMMALWENPVRAQSETAIKILILGDSLTEGYGVLPEKAYPVLLEQSLLSQGYAVSVINGGESGSTSAGGLSRLNWYLRGKPDIVVVALGGNDGLRGQPIIGLKNNLETIIKRIKAQESKVLLAGMKIPPNYGADYTSRFANTYPQLAKSLEVPLIPFLLEGVGGHAQMMQADAIHPNEKGQAIIATLVERALLENFSKIFKRKKK